MIDLAQPLTRPLPRPGASSSDYVLPPTPAWAPFTKTRTVLLPDRLFEEHDCEHAESHTHARARRADSLPFAHARSDALEVLDGLAARD